MRNLLLYSKMNLQVITDAPQSPPPLMLMKDEVIAR